MVYVKEEMKRNDLQEQAVIGLLWSCLMNAVEWNKKEELVTEQALKHLKVHWLRSVFSSNALSIFSKTYCNDYGTKFHITVCNIFSHTAGVMTSLLELFYGQYTQFRERFHAEQKHREQKYREYKC